MAGRAVKARWDARTLWRRHRERMDVELWDYRARTSSARDLIRHVVLDGQRPRYIAGSPGGTVDGRGGSRLLLRGVEPRVEHRIKETESGVWWKILDVTDSSTDHFQDCRCVCWR